MTRENVLVGVSCFLLLSSVKSQKIAEILAFSITAYHRQNNFAEKSKILGRIHQKSNFLLN